VEWDYRGISKAIQYLLKKDKTVKEFYRLVDSSGWKVAEETLTEQGLCLKLGLYQGTPEDAEQLREYLESWHEYNCAPVIQVGEHVIRKKYCGEIGPGYLLETNYITTWAQISFETLERLNEESEG
jgi:hypothetical protein